MKEKLKIPKVIISFLSIVALTVPLMASFVSIGDYLLHIVIQVMLYMILALGLNIMSGFTGLLDLGYVGFYGIGAYTAGLLSVHFNLSYWLVIPLAALNGALWGVLLGAPTLRLTGDYFAIVTFGFSEIVILILRNWIGLTRGPMGLLNIPPPSISIPFTNIKHELYNEWEYYYLILIMLAATIIIMSRLQDSRLGRAWAAIREDERAAQACGINLMEYKVIAFAISASFGAIGGSFLARWSRFIHPDHFQFWESIFILCMIVLGGMGSIRGILLGAAILGSLGEILRIVLPLISPSLSGARYLVFGVILVIMMRSRPAGLLPISKTKG